MKNITYRTLLSISAFTLMSLSFACKGEITRIKSVSSTFAKGADISWLPQMEADGYKFLNAQGVQEDCFKILKDHGINSIRLRTWVNPSNDKINGHCSKDETVAMAVRAQSWGMRVMIDFHYSDSWADPSKQVKPAAWVGHDFPTLLADVYNYTFDVMTALKTAGVSPEWVQVGNEITTGMILPEGSTNNWSQLAQLINKGYDAVKAVSPLSKVILHIDRGNDNSISRWWFDNITANRAKYDVIGLSYYPFWLTGNPDYSLSINNLGSNLNDMASRYNKEVMVVEVGGEDFKSQNTYDMLMAVQNKVKAVPNGAGLGVMYWEPEGARSWSGYGLSAWGSDGKPTKALDAFNDINSEVINLNISPLSVKWNNQTHTFTFNQQVAIASLYDISGKMLIHMTNNTSFTPSSLTKGIYIIKAKRLISSESLIMKVIRQ